LDVLAAPVEVTGATATYRQESDALGVFIAECCVLPDGTGLYESDLKVGASDLYARFKQWCADGGEHCITQTDFGRRLRERGFDRKPFGKTRRDHYFGIGLREPVKHREGETV
jgi:putative DNA primase/helicase